MTTQEKIWKTKFGEEYNLRNMYDNKALDEIYSSDIGISRTCMNEQFIGNLDREAKILEVGCNIGLQLVNLQEMDFKNLFGIEIQGHAVEIARKRTEGINIIEATAHDIPFKDNYFDMVFTNRVLIHISPAMLVNAMKEIVRCSRDLIYGSEYYSESPLEIRNYHGMNNIAWKRNFAELYSQTFEKLELLKEVKYKYRFNDDVDSTFLFRKSIP